MTYSSHFSKVNLRPTVISCNIHNIPSSNNSVKAMERAKVRTGECGTRELVKVKAGECGIKEMVMVKAGELVMVKAGELVKVKAGELRVQERERFRTLEHGIMECGIQETGILIKLLDLAVSLAILRPA